MAPEVIACEENPDSTYDYRVSVTTLHKAAERVGYCWNPAQVLHLKSSNLPPLNHDNIITV